MPRHARLPLCAPLLALTLTGCVTQASSATSGSSSSSVSHTDVPRASAPHTEPPSASQSPAPASPATAASGGGVTPTVPGETSPPEGMPATPDAALHETDAGARAFAAHYFTVETTAYATMNGLLLNPLSDADCSPCYRTFASIEEEWEQHHTFSGYRRAFTATSVVHHPDEPHTVSVVGTLTGTSGRRLDQEGTPLNTVEPPTGRAAVSMTWRRDHWLVTNLQALD